MSRAKRTHELTDKRVECRYVGLAILSTGNEVRVEGQWILSHWDSLSASRDRVLQDTIVFLKSLHERFGLTSADIKIVMETKLTERYTDTTTTAKFHSEHAAPFKEE